MADPDPEIGPVMALVREELRVMHDLDEAEAKKQPLYAVVKSPQRLLFSDYAYLIRRLLGQTTEQMPEGIVDDIYMDLIPQKGSYWKLLMTMVDPRMERDTLTAMTSRLPEMMEDVNDDRCFLRLTKGALPITTAGLLLFIATYAKVLAFPPFLFAAVERHPDTSPVPLLVNVLVQSKLHFLLTGNYLPIVVLHTFSECDHNTACVYLPAYDPQSQISLWYRIFFDSAGMSLDSCTTDYSDYAAWETSAFQIYEHVFSTLKSGKTDLQLMNISCIGNLQGYSTGSCSHWATMLPLMFVYNYEYLLGKLRSNPFFVAEWFNATVDPTEKHLTHYARVFVKLRRVFYKRYLQVIKCIDPDYTGRSLADLFLRAVLFEMPKKDKGYRLCRSQLKQEPTTHVTFIRDVKKTLAECLIDMEQGLRVHETARRRPSAQRSSPGKDALR